MKPIRILTYKRTHTGDPDRRGRFGMRDCMGRVRSLRFDAVISVGGTGPEPQRFGIARKLTWIGIGPRRTFWGAGRAELVEFEHFLLLDARGPDLVIVAPQLAKLMYDRNRRFVLDAYPEAAYVEALRLLDMARQGTAAAAGSRRCARRCGTPQGCVPEQCRPKWVMTRCRRPPA